MTTPNWVFWLPQGLCIAFALFISIFALDVFGHGEDLWKTLLALLVHLVPSFLVIGLAALVWHHPWVGALGGVALAALYVIAAWGRFPLSVCFVIAGPMVLVAGLFLWEGLYPDATATPAG